MAETSRFWTTDDTGDGPLAGYTMADFYDFVRALLISDQEASQGVLRSVLNELAVSGASSPVSVASGAAIVYGFFYRNTAALDLTVTTPVVGTTGGRVNLTVDWTAQTVRSVVQLNTDGTAGIPALVQTIGSAWSIPLATFTITMAGTITLTDARSFCQFANYLTATAFDAVTGLSVIGRSVSTTGASGEITADSDGEVLLRNGSTLEFGQVASAGLGTNIVSDAKLRQSAGLSVIGRSANTTGNVADIVAGSDGHVLRLSGTALGFGTVAAAGIADGAVTADKIAADSVDDTKAGNRVPQFYRRQGGSATEWSTAGTSNYTPGAVRMQAGTINVAIGNGDNYGSTAVTFPVAFSYKPVIVLNASSSSTTVIYSPVSDSIAADTFTARLGRDTTSGDVTIAVYWIAIGPE